MEEVKQKIVPFEEMSYEDGEVCIDEVTVQYVQSGDCTEDESDCQELTLSTRNNGMARFINIKTGKNGWSIGDISELEQIIKDFKKRAL